MVGCVSRFGLVLQAYVADQRACSHEPSSAEIQSAVQSLRQRFDFRLLSFQSGECKIRQKGRLGAQKIEGFREGFRLGIEV